MHIRFVNEINPLIQKLLAANENSDIEIASDYQIVYIPQNENLYYVQTILQLTSTPEAEKDSKIYVLYDYSRGGDLSTCFLCDAETQEITAKIRLVVEENGSFLIEEKEATGGSRSISVQGIVENAILPLSKLGPSGGVVEKDLDRDHWLCLWNRYDTRS